MVKKSVNQSVYYATQNLPSEVKAEMERVRRECPEGSYSTIYHHQSDDSTVWEVRYHYTKFKVVRLEEDSEGKLQKVSLLSPLKMFFSRLIRRNKDEDDE